MKSVRYGTIALLTVVLGLLIYLIGQQVTPPALAPAPRGYATWEVHFSPNGGCTAAIVRALRGARKSILVQAYTFTSQPIADALAQAKQRGVAVEAVLDDKESNANHSEVGYLARMNIPTYLDAQHNIAHNKVIVIDDAIVITGSFNFTHAAEESNAENLLILHDQNLAAAYTANWRHHRAHSERYRQ